MVLHKCEICNYTTTFPTNIKNHLLTKKHIRNVEKYNEEKNTHISSNTRKKPSKKTQIIKCDYCSNIFSRKDNLIRHYNSCKVKKELDEIKRKEDEEKKKEEQKKEEKDIVVNKLLEEITKKDYELKKKKMK